MQGLTLQRTLDNTYYVGAKMTHTLITGHYGLGNNSDLVITWPCNACSNILYVKTTQATIKANCLCIAPPDRIKETNKQIWRLIRKVRSDILQVTVALSVSRTGFHGA